MLEIKFKPLLSCRIKSKSTEKFFTLQFVLFNTGEFIELTLYLLFHFQLKKCRECYFISTYYSELLRNSKQFLIFAVDMEMKDLDMEAYILSHIDEEPDVLKKLTRDTNLYTLKPRMLSGHLQGRMLKMFCAMVEAKNVLEIGTFTGYSALCMAEVIPDDGTLHTFEINDEMEEFLLNLFQTVPNGNKIELHIGDALDLLPDLNEEFDLAFIDANKRHYVEYFNLVFPKIRKGGLIIADNTLWDGHVLEHDSKDSQTLGIQKFNDYIRDNQFIEKVILPIRDGMTLIRKL